MAFLNLNIYILSLHVEFLAGCSYKCLNVLDMVLFIFYDVQLCLERLFNYFVLFSC